MKVRFFDIEWDLDKGERAHLPSECVLEVEDDLDLQEEGADALSDEYGWCVSRCSFEVVGQAVQD